MEMRAILIVGGRSPLSAAFASEEERMAGVPLALCDVLGATVLERTLARIEQAGITSVAVLLDSTSRYTQALRTQSATDVSFHYASSPADLWTAAQTRFDLFARASDHVLVQRLGPYAEIEYEDVLQHHLDQRNRVTEVVSADGAALDCFLLKANRRSDAAYLFRSQMQPPRMPFIVSSGYSNSLRRVADLRLIAMDAFANKNAIRPIGTEVKPGVWAAPGVRIHRSTRILAPAYIGAHAQVCASSVLTRGAVVEHHCEIDCGTVLEGTSVLPYSYVGAGLEFMSSVVGFSYVAHLGRGISIKIEDPRLIGMRNTGALTRTLESAWELVSYLPKEFTRGFLRRPARIVPRAVEAAAPVQSLTKVRDSEGEPVLPSLAAELISVRRYGNE